MREEQVQQPAGMQRGKERGGGWRCCGSAGSAEAHARLLLLLLLLGSAGRPAGGSCAVHPAPAAGRPPLPAPRPQPSGCTSAAAAAAALLLLLTSQDRPASASGRPAARLAWFFSSWGRKRKRNGMVLIATRRVVTSPQSECCCGWAVGTAGAAGSSPAPSLRLAAGGASRRTSELPAPPASELALPARESASGRLLVVEKLCSCVRGMRPLCLALAVHDAEAAACSSSTESTSLILPV